MNSQDIRHLQGQVDELLAALEAVVELRGLKEQVLEKLIKAKKSPSVRAIQDEAHQMYSEYSRRSPIVYRHAKAVVARYQLVPKPSIKIKPNMVKQS